MAIFHPRPPQVNGATFDRLGVELAIRTVPRNYEMVLDIIVSFQPYRDRLANGPESLPAGVITSVFPDALDIAAKNAEQGDYHLAAFLADLEAAAQRYVNAKV